MCKKNNFVGLLRISEPLSLRVCDALLPEDHGAGPFLVLLLQKAKTHEADVEKVIIRDPGVILFVRHHLQSSNRLRMRGSVIARTALFPA